MIRNFKNKKISILMLILASFGGISCGDRASSDKEAPPNIVEPPNRAADFTVLSFDLPDGKGGYIKIDPKDFIDGFLGKEIFSPKYSTTVSPLGEENTAKEQAIFMSYPGILFQLSPPTPFTATLSSRGNSQSKNFEASTNGRNAVSFLNFPTVFPPLFREKYELSIASFPGAPQPFTYTVSFFISRTDAEVQTIAVGDSDPITKVRLGEDTPIFLLSKLTPKNACLDCVIEVTINKAVAQIKTFTELPALPLFSYDRLTQPRRSSGLIVSTSSRPVGSTVVGNASASVSIYLSLNKSLTTVRDWCRGALGPQCIVPFKGARVPTFFKFVNAVPTDMTVNMFGGTGGIASISFSGEFVARMTRSGKLMEERTISVSTRSVGPLDQPFLPKWAIDDIRQALNSGAPEFTQ